MGSCVGWCHKRDFIRKFLYGVDFLSKLIPSNPLQNDPANPMNVQINHNNVTSYGATEHVAGNPFATAPAMPPMPVAGNPFAQNIQPAAPVQPYPTDSYMHGTADERGFNQY